ncbi:UNC-like C-terminal-domain-containing protein [Lenzites betulinus]|nr:UNC-like C-terminal-domain-containing protein [Lenzites betulinus]
MLLSLPKSLLALLFASPVLSGPTTANDPFHDIAIHAPKPPEEPICCLRPLSPLEPPTEEDILLSFEEWKAKRLSDAAEREPAPAQSTAHKPPENASQAAIPDASPHHANAQGSPSPEVQENGGPQESLSSHLMIPLHDRFNYASLDCSARVHAAHKSAKSPSSILSSKKDRYMLSPCAEGKQFVIVELCEDIRIDTVQLANYEFFSGVFKDFSVSVSKKYYPNDPESWTFAGTFHAKNVRGVQSFHPPPTLRGFYRFIRLDFHSHYGNEYYCPLSLLRVYGLTHLEEWQWETWDAESRAKRVVEEASQPVEVFAELPQPIHVPITEHEKTEEQGPALSGPGDDASPSPGYSTNSVASVTMDASPVAQDSPSPSPHTLDAIPKTQESFGGSHHQPQQETLSPIHKSVAEHILNDHSRFLTDTLYNTQPISAHSSSVTLTSSIPSSASSSHAQSFNVSTASDNHSSIFIVHHTDSGSPSASSQLSAAALPIVSSLSVISPSYSHPAPPAPPSSTGGESIYRLIMNRLTALEANTTLYARYVEEQTAGMRDVLRRLGEDIGRLESIGRTQAQLFQRSVGELERQTRRLETEHQQLMSRVNHLTDEVVLEKRLGIAQLCLLLTVLVFMALTRGSRGEVVYTKRGGSTMREWGRRTLSISGDWVNRLRTRSATPPRPTTQKARENDLAFPSLDTQVVDPLSRSARRGPPNGFRRHATRPHTPTIARTPTTRHAHHRAVPPSPSLHLPRPGIQRSSSGSMTLGFGGVGPVPKSAKRWARSAHLHEVRGDMTSTLIAEGSQRRRSRTPGQLTPVVSRRPSDDADTGDIFHTPSRAQVHAVASLDGLSTISKGKGRAIGLGLQPLRQPSPLRPSPMIDLPSPPHAARGRTPQRRPSHTESEQSEGDAWVDTDVDGSECDLVLDASAVASSSSSGARERTYVGSTATAASNSL